MSTSTDYHVADLGLAEWGRREIAIAETEMPGLMAVRTEYGPQQPLKGARIAGCLHMTIQTAVLIETLKALGATSAGPRATSSRPRTTPPPRSPPAAHRCSPVKGETLDEYWDYVHRIFAWGDGGFPNMILDDGGDATLLVHLGRKAEQDPTVLDDPRTRRRRPLHGDQAPAQGEARLYRARRSVAASPRRPRPASTGSTTWRSRASCCSRRSTSTTA